MESRGRVSNFNEWCLNYFKSRNLDSIIDSLEGFDNINPNEEERKKNNLLNKLSTKYSDEEISEMDLISQLLGKGKIINSKNSKNSGADDNIPLQLVEDELILLDNSEEDSLILDDGIPENKYEEHPDSDLVNKNIRKKRKAQLKIETIIEDTQNKKLKQLYTKYLNGIDRETQWDIGISCGDMSLLKKMIENFGFEVTKMERIGIGPLMIDTHFRKEWHSKYCDLSQNNGVYFGVDIGNIPIDRAK